MKQPASHSLSGTNPSVRETRFLNTLPLIRKIALSRLTGHYRESVSDLVQIVGLNLWSWQHRRATRIVEQAALPEDLSSTSAGQTTTAPVAGQPSPALEDNELSGEEWLKVAARASVNEINSFYNSKFHREMLWGVPEHLTLPELFPYYGSCRIEGETQAEVASLLNYLWSEMQTLSLRQRYCFLLSKDEFVDDLIGHGVCRLNDLAQYLSLETEEFMLILENLPLADEAICRLIKEKTGIEITLRQFWTTRSKARAKLACQFKEAP